MILLSQIVIAGYYKKALIAVVCLCVALFACSVNAKGQRPEVRSQESGVSQEPRISDQELCEERFQYFNDFIVYMKYDHKKNRILVCDVVIELNRGIKLTRERIELRKIIYNTLKKPSDLRELRRSLKEKIKIILNNFMGGEIIKDVYFLKFTLL